MQIYHSLSDATSLENVAVTVGNFDGVHLGHQYLLNELKSYPNHLVITFANHPVEFFQKQPTQTLISNTQKIALLEKLGIEHVAMIPFDKTFSETPFDIFIDLLLQKGMKTLVLGKNSCLGKGRKGDEKTLQKYSTLKPFSLRMIQKKQLHDGLISTSSIKECIRQGNVDLAAQFLGRNYCVHFHELKDPILPNQGIYYIPELEQNISIEIVKSNVPKEKKLTFLPRRLDKTHSTA